MSSFKTAHLNLPSSRSVIYTNSGSALTGHIGWYNIGTILDRSSCQFYLKDVSMLLTVCTFYVYIKRIEGHLIPNEKIKKLGLIPFLESNLREFALDDEQGICWELLLEIFGNLVLHL